ncbi:MAG: response regulator, partial [Gammaproteobacteria bacterium]
MKQATQERLRLLQQLFQQQLPDKLHDLEQALHAYQATPADPARLNLLYRLVHNLAGTAGTFGATQVSDQALQLERLLKPLLDQPTPAEPQQLEPLGEQLACLHRLAYAWSQEHRTPSAGHDPGGLEQPDKQLLYLADADDLMTRQLRSALETGPYEVQHFSDGPGLQQAYAQQRPSLILVDVAFMESAVGGAEALHHINNGPVASPPLIFYSERNDMRTRLAAQRAGAARYFHRPLDMGKLRDCIDAVTHRQVGE